MILHADKDAAQQYAKNHRSAYLNSITDESETPGKPDVESVESSVLQANEGVTPLKNLMIHEHTYGSVTSQEMQQNMVVEEKS